ncbi:ADP-ribosyltransferase [Streptomyces sp. NPDC127037]|uniref:ADP-ribosyltransferase n=1 Tax=Streptomyces sp. NPDC127037 TaxID=3347113 RepID=UPI0036559DBA
MADRIAQLDQAEAEFTDAVAAALTATADEFADAVTAATELVAARFSVGRIARMWGARTRGLMRRLLGTAGEAATAAAEDIGEDLPDGWDDLPGRYDDDTLPEALGQYVETTEHLLRAVGDRLAEAARTELAAGIDAGEDIEQLRARLRDAFTREGAHLGPVREERIARTEASRAWNTATLAAAQAAAGPDRPVVKQWITRHDSRVRTAHAEANGQIQLLAEPFTVGGVAMQAPGDPTAPAGLVINCRCRLSVAPELRAVGFGSQDRSSAAVQKAREPLMVDTDAATFHGTQGRPSYRKFHPSGNRKGKTQHRNGGWLGSDRFTEEEHSKALRDYTSNAYERMNQSLRHGTFPKSETAADRVRHQVQALSDLINIQEPTAEETTLYRRMENNRLALKVGDEFHDKGFLSTSKRSDVLPIETEADDPNTTLFKISLPAGAQALDVVAAGRDGFGADEQEVILPPGTKFRVRAVVNSGDPAGPPSYELEVVNAVVAATPPRSQRAEPPHLIAATGDSALQQRATWQPEDIVVDRRASATISASAATHTGAMIALMPTATDAERLALAAAGSEPAEELHLTLFYLGEGADWDEEHRADLIAGLRSRLADVGEPLAARAFGAAHWNTDGDDPCWVWSVGDDRDSSRDAPRLENARWAATYALEDMHRQPDLHAQHTPWQPHVCAAYSSSPSLLAAMNERLGPIRFDRVRVAFAGEYTDIPLGREEEATLMDDDETVTTGPLAARAWSTPGDTALAYEDTETGDGRVFRPGSLYWSGMGPWPLQYADEMLMGHQGAELAGSIQTVGRDGDRITGTGVLYPGLAAGSDALMVLEERGPLGVSVDLDDVSVEFVDRSTPSEGDEPAAVLLASLPSASLLPMGDGSWSLTTAATTEWTASGGALSRHGTTAQLITGPGGVVTAAAVHAALATTGTLTAAAGDRDDQNQGTVVHSESSGDLLMRITRARLRGATLVAMPAYDQARIVLDDQTDDAPYEEDGEEWAATAGPSPAQQKVIRFVRTAPSPVGAREVARGLRIRMQTARGHLARAAKAGHIVRLARGLYVGPSTDMSMVASGDDGDELVASAWTAMQDADPMPAAWFREPTAEELPPGSGGVHYANGRIYGWVAQAGEPHAGYPGKKLTVESLGKLDLTHFLRARFKLDDGSLVKAGAFTMNVGHHRDGAECETAACQFDDTRSVAGIVTVGQNAGGLWFSGAAAPWLSEWDRSVFAACQPSYHMKSGPGGQWQLRAVLSVPVPGHSSPLLATAVAERSNLALAASAALALVEPDMSGQRPDVVPDNPDNPATGDTGTVSEQGGHRPDTAPDSVRSAGLSSAELDALTSVAVSGPLGVDALLAALGQLQQDAARAEAQALAASVIAPAREEIAAGHTTTTTDREF